MTVSFDRVPFAERTLPVLLSRRAELTPEKLLVQHGDI